MFSLSPKEHGSVSNAGPQDPVSISHEDSPSDKSCQTELLGGELCILQWEVEKLVELHGEPPSWLTAFDTEIDNVRDTETEGQKDSGFGKAKKGSRQAGSKKKGTVAAQKARQSRKEKEAGTETKGSGKTVQKTGKVAVLESRKEDEQEKEEGAQIKTRRGSDQAGRQTRLAEAVHKGVRGVVRQSTKEQEREKEAVEAGTKTRRGSGQEGTNRNLAEPLQKGAQGVVREAQERQKESVEAGTGTLKGSGKSIDLDESYYMDVDVDLETMEESEVTASEFECPDT